MKIWNPRRILTKPVAETESLEKEPRWIIWYSPLFLLAPLAVILSFCFLIKYSEVIKIPAKVLPPDVERQGRIGSACIGTKNSNYTIPGGYRIIVGYIDMQNGANIRKGAEAVFTYNSKLYHSIIDSTVVTDRDVMVYSNMRLDAKDRRNIDSSGSIILSVLTTKKTLYTRIIGKLRRLK